MLKEKDFSKKVDTTEAISVKINQLEEKELRKLLGVAKLDKEVRNLVKEAKRKQEEMKKDFEKGKSPEKPTDQMLLIIMLKLHVENQRGKKFDIIALGTQNRWSYLVNGF